jgi:hypothetical protein
MLPGLTATLWCLPLCLVDVVGPHERQVTAACAYPAADGLEIDTGGPQAVAVRRMMLEFMLARSPTSDVSRGIAAEAGVSKTRFTTNAASYAGCVCESAATWSARRPSASSAAGLNVRWGALSGPGRGLHWLWGLRGRVPDRRCED